MQFLMRRRAAIFLIFFFASASTFAELTHVEPQTLRTTNLATGETQDLTTLDKNKTNVVIFMSPNCACSKSHLAHIKNLRTQFPDVHFVVVHSNTDESAEFAQKYFSAAHLDFPVIQDQGLAIATLYKAYKTPHAFVIDGDGTVEFSGGITDKSDATKAQHFYLQDALVAVRDHRKPVLTVARALGCEIRR